MKSKAPKIGITLMDTDRGLNPAQLAIAVEARGFDSLFLAEHSHIPTSRRSRWPGSRPGHTDPLPETYRRINDQIVALSMAAAVTKKLILGTSVTLIAQHDPIWLAKQVATLDHWSAGRVLLGVGFGWNEEQMEGHGRDYSSRRERTEEYIAAMRALWTEEQAEYYGRFVELEPSWAYPKPAQPGGPKIVLGGGTGPVLFDAITRYADGWMPISGRDSLADRIQPLRDQFAAAGRDPKDMEIIVCGATTDPAGLINLGKEGVTHALLTIWPEDPDEIMHTLDEYAAIAKKARKG